MTSQLAETEDSIAHAGDRSALADGQLPTFLGVGAAKSGTTAIYNYLVQHPSVFMSPIKETNFFSRDIDPAGFRRDYRQHEKQKRLDVAEFVKGPMRETEWGAYVRELSHYRALFRDAKPDQARGEISNSYLYSEAACDEIRRVVPGARVFMILRNPVDRAYSHYLANLRDGRAIRPFREELEADTEEPRRAWGCAHLYLDLGMYSRQVERYLERIPAAQRRIYLYDDLRRDTEGLMCDLFRFIGVDAGVRVNMERRHNKARVPRAPRLVYALSSLGIKKPLFRLIPEAYRDKVKNRFFRGESLPAMSKEDRAWLVDIYQDDIRDLQRLLDRDLGHWLG